MDSLILNNSVVISGSSDRTLKLWKPSDGSIPESVSKLGHHADYVKSVAYAEYPSWVASGGLDRKVLIWDIHETRKDTPIGIFPL